MKNRKLFRKADSAANNAIEIESVINDLIREIQDLENKLEEKEGEVKELKEQLSNQ